MTTTFALNLASPNAVAPLTKMTFIPKLENRSAAVRLTKTTFVLNQASQSIAVTTTTMPDRKSAVALVARIRTRNIALRDGTMTRRPLLLRKALVARSERKTKRRTRRSGADCLGCSTGSPMQTSFRPNLARAKMKTIAIGGARKNATVLAILLASLVIVLETLLASLVIAPVILRANLVATVLVILPENLVVIVLATPPEIETKATAKNAIITTIVTIVTKVRTMTDPGVNDTTIAIVPMNPRLQHWDRRTPVAGNPSTTAGMMTMTMTTTLAAFAATEKKNTNHGTAAKLKRSLF